MLPVKGVSRKCRSMACAPEQLLEALEANRAGNRQPNADHNE